MTNEPPNFYEHLKEKFVPTHLNPYGKPVQVLYSQCYKDETMIPGVVYVTADGWVYWTAQEQFNKTDKKRNRIWPELKE